MFDFIPKSEGRTADCTDYAAKKSVRSGNASNFPVRRLCAPLISNSLICAIGVICGSFGLPESKFILCAVVRGSSRRAGRPCHTGARSRFTLRFAEVPDARRLACGLAAGNRPGALDGGSRSPGMKCRPKVPNSTLVRAHQGEKQFRDGLR